ncbi:MAG: LLM class flavin-dependent oxidoreductase [Candidatus Bathyarchaeia archaeon]
MKRFKIGIDVSFQFSEDPEYTLNFVKLAEEAGFDSIWFGDHFHPWHHSFKHSVYVWSIIPAAAERTRSVPLGVDVTVPIGGRYHPAIIAQAAATIDRLYPGRFLLGVGSGEAVSEVPFLGYWPSWRERTERTVEAIELIKRLWSSEDFFSFEGKYFKMRDVYLYVKPKKPIPIYFSGIGERAAYYAGKYGDHLMTCNTWERCRDLIYPSFERGARSAKKDLRKMEKLVCIGGGIGDEKKVIEKIRKFIAGASIRAMFDERDPRKVEAEGSKLSDETIKRDNLILSSPDELIEVIDNYRKIGTDHLVYTDWSPSYKETMKVFKEKIIPCFRCSQ